MNKPLALLSTFQLLSPPMAADIQKPDALRDPRTDPAVSVETLQRVDECCEQFERRWQESKPESIEPLLSGWHGLERRALLRELLAIDLEYRRGRGEAVSPEALKSRFAGDEDIVDLVLSETPIDGSEDGFPPFLSDHPRYRVVARIGSGGMGTVYRAEHALLGRPVAIKVIRPQLLADRLARERFLQEARSAARLNHPNIVTIYDAELSPDGPFLVMECVEGTDLARIVRDNGPLPVAEACEAVRQAAEGLQDAYESGLVHRDLSPRNLMRTEDGTVKLLDFGLALVFGQQNPAEVLGTSGMLMGSAEYMSPEQAENPAQSDVRSDIYSLGCVLWFLLTGQPPRRVRNKEELNRLRAGRPLPRLGSLRAEAPPEVEAVLMKALSTSPQSRYQTPQELADALAPFTGEVATPPARPKSRGRVAMVAAACVIGAMTIGLAAQRHFGRPEERDRPTERMYQEALVLLGQRQERQAHRAIDRLNAVLLHHPHDAEAYSVLADAWNLCGDYGWELPSVAFPNAMKAARRALELNPEHAEAHLALAFAYHGYECDWKRAGESYTRALELNEDLPSANHWYAWYLAQQGRFAEAKEHIDRAAEEAEAKDLIIHNDVGKIRYFAREFKEAAAAHRHTLDLDPDFRKARLDLGYALIELGETEEALDEFDKAKGISERNGDVNAALAYAYARSGQSQQAEEIVSNLAPDAERNGLAMEMAHVDTALGDFDSALNWIDIALRQKSSGRAGLLVDPRLDPLRKEPRFKAALKSIGLADKVLATEK